MTARPAVAAPAPWAFPTPHEHRLANGVRVLLHPMPGQHVVSVVAVLDVPLAAEPREREGVATLLARVLDEGSRSHPGEAYAEALEAVGAALHVNHGLSGLQVMLDVPATRLRPALALLAEALREPEVRAEDVRRHAALRLADIAQQRAASAPRAAIELRGALWDPVDRASRAPGGEPDTVATVDADGAREFHAAWYGPAVTTLVVAGELPDDTVAQLDDVLGDWSGGPAGAPADPEPTHAAPRVHLVDRPGAVQADLRLAGFGPDRRDPLWAPFQVAAYAVGGGFLSRLNARLREGLGWTYGIHLSPSPRRTGGAWVVAGSCRTEVAADAVVEAHRLLDVTARPVTAEEVERAVSAHTGTAPLRYATAEGVADQQAANVLNRTPVDHVTRWLAALGTVTPEAATAAYARFVERDALALVVVGDAAAIRPGLEAAGWLA